MLAEIATETGPAETAEFLETDANSFTFAVRTADRNRVIFESAYTNIKIGKESTKHSFPESLFRYGLTDRLEFHFGYDYELRPRSATRLKEISRATLESMRNSRYIMASNIR